MRIALIGPVGKSESQLDRALDVSFASMHADRVVYLGDPELVIRRRKRSHAGGDGENLWSRSLRCVSAESEVIDRFVAAERKRLDWARLELVPEEGRMQIAVTGLTALVTRDSSHDENEGDAFVVIAPVAPDNGAAFEVKESAGRLFVAPGNLDQAGLVVITDEEELSVEIYNLRGKQLERHVVDGNGVTQSAARS